MIIVSGGILMKKTLLAGMMAAAASVMVPGLAGAEAEIGRASCRERVLESV